MNHSFPGSLRLVCGILLLLFMTEERSPSQSKSSWSPIALAYIEPNNIIMLSIGGEVWSLLSQATVAPERPIARVPAVWWVTDIGAAGNREWNRILISANSANSSKGDVKQTFLEVLSLA